MLGLRVAIASAILAATACAFDLRDPIQGDGGPLVDGANPNCADTLDVMPLVRISTSGPVFDLSMAALSDTVGVAWCGQTTVDGGPVPELRFATIGPGGAASQPIVLGNMCQNVVSVAASGKSFGVTGDSIPTIYRVGKTAPIDTVPISAQGQHGLVGSPNGFLLTTLVQGSTLTAQWLADGTSTLTSPAMYPAEAGVPVCCADRRFDGVFGFGATDFAVAWNGSNGGPGLLEIDRVTSAGIPSMTTWTTASGIGDTRPIVALAKDRVLAGDCGHLTRIGPSGQVDPAMAMPNDKASSCVVASDPTGTVIRAARVISGAIEWRAIDPTTGAGPVLLRFGMAGGGRLGVAWDGTGFGLVWGSSGGFSYAHVHVCGT